VGELIDSCPPPHFIPVITSGASGVEKFEKEKRRKTKDPMSQPRISRRSGMKIIAFTSIAMAMLTAWQVIPSKGSWKESFWIFIWRFDLGNFLW
jgi:hypothetical protein